MVDLAATHGVGLLGPGAVSAARALLVTMLAQHRGRPVRILIPEPDLTTLFATIPDVLPRAVRVAASLDDALDYCEAELLARARHQICLPPLVLFAAHTAHIDRRLQNILDNGSTLGLAAVLIGHWRAGTTIRVRADGTVSATTADNDRLTGARLFHLNTTETADLLALLADADDLHDDDPSQSTSTGQHDNAGNPPVPADDIDSPVTKLDKASEDAERSTASPRSIVLAPGPVSPDHEPQCWSVEIPSQPPVENLAATASGLPPPDRAARTWLLRVFGNTDLVLHGDHGKVDLSAAVTPKQREILVFLALNAPNGVRRDVLNDTLWPDSPRGRPYNAMHNALSGLRRRLSEIADARLGQLVISQDGRYRLDPALVATDYDQLRHPSPDPRSNTRHQQIIDLYRGDLAEDITAAWVEPYREAIRRDVLDAVSTLVRKHADDPTAALALLERARSLDPYNESVYREIIQTQARLDQHDSIERTLTLLRSVLADLDLQPSNDTVNLARALQRRQLRTAAS